MIGMAFTRHPPLSFTFPLFFGFSFHLLHQLPIMLLALYVTLSFALGFTCHDYGIKSKRIIHAFLMKNMGGGCQHVNIALSL